MATLASIKSTIAGEFDGNHSLKQKTSALNTAFAGGGLFSTEFTVTAAAIGTAHSTPIELVAAESGKVHIPIACYMKLDYLTAAYNDQQMQIIHTGETITHGIMDGMNASADAWWTLVCAASANTANLTPEGLALEIEADGDMGTTGKGTLEGVIVYRTVDVATGLQ